MLILLAKFELKQRIKREILPNIRKYETEYWKLYPHEAIIISDEEAETQLVRVEEAVTSIEQIPFSTYPSELISLLQVGLAVIAQFKMHLFWCPWM
ncbi:MAG: hypothetical protein ACRC2S_19740 [Waterburya sp.]